MPSTRSGHDLEWRRSPTKGLALRLRAPRPTDRDGDPNGRPRPPASAGDADSYRRLADLFHDLLSEQTLDALLDRVADALAELVPHDTLTVYRADPDGRILLPVLARDRWAPEILGSPCRVGEGITGWAVEHREAVRIAQVQLDPRAATIPGTPPDEPEALISVPLIARGAVKGALNVYRLGEDASFSAAELELAERFADAAALAIDNAEARARLEHQARTDPLTGLENHRSFHERLRAEVARAGRDGTRVALVMLDIDEFKRLNDVHGHGVGDAALARIGELLIATARENDIVCRVGGEEFAVIMGGRGTADAVALGRRIAERLAATSFEPAGRLTASIGVAQTPGDALNAPGLAACAESAMMSAKAAGGARVVVFGERDPARPQSAAEARRDARSIAHLKLLQSIVGKLNRLNDRAEIGATIVAELRTLLDYHNGRVYLAEGDLLVPIAFRGELGLYGAESADVLACRFGEGITGRAAQAGRSLLIGNALECDFAVQVPGTPEIEESIVAVPLLYGSRVTGVIVISKLGLDQFDEDDVRLLEVLAGHASSALENARLYEEARLEAAHARESAEIARSLLEFSREVAMAEGLEDTLERVAQLSSRVIGACRTSIWLQAAAGHDLVLQAHHGYTDGEAAALAAIRFSAERALTLAGHDGPYIATRDDAAPQALPGWTSARFAVAPLRLEAGRHGCLVVSEPADEERLSPRRLRLLTGLADQAKLALSHASSFEALERTFLSTVEALANALEASDEYTSSHARELTDMALHVGTALGLEGIALKRLELGALFHDIGKIGIPSEILSKPGPLTPAERALVEQHPRLGERIVAPIERLAAVRPIVRHCHERWSGGGYPDGLYGEEIPLESRIIAVCDAYSAMTSDRPYRTRLSREEARRRLGEGAGTQFDPRVVETFLTLLP